MKFIGTESEIIKSPGGIVMEAMPMSPAKHARMLDFLSDDSVEGRVAMVSFVLKDCIDTLKIKGKDVDPSKVADFCDLKDVETLEIFIAIGSSFIEKMFLDGNEEKK